MCSTKTSNSNTTRTTSVQTHAVLSWEMAVQEGCAVTSLLVQGNSARAGVYLPTLSSYNITPSYRPLCGTDVGYGVSGFGGGLYVDSCFQVTLPASLPDQSPLS